MENHFYEVRRPFTDPTNTIINQLWLLKRSNMSKYSFIEQLMHDYGLFKILTLSDMQSYHDINNDKSQMNFSFFC